MNRALARRRDRAITTAHALGFGAPDRPPGDASAGPATTAAGDGTLEARDEERVLRLKVLETSDGDALAVLRLVLTVPVKDAPTLGIRPLTLGRALAVQLGLVRATSTQDTKLEERALVQAADPLRARAALSAGLSATALELLDAFPEAELLSGGGELTVSIDEGEGRLPRLLELAGRALVALEGARMKPVPRESVARCGFCHGDLVPEEKDVRCDRCGATVHASCWDDHAGCPALGCSGRAR